MLFESPNEIYQELFIDLHESGLWLDGKAISDAIPLFSPEEILIQYRRRKSDSDFDLKHFFDQNFRIVSSRSTDFVSDTSRPVSEHIEHLWDVLKREKDRPQAGGSLIPLPYPYIVPGGRFNEIYYWDSYFTMLGLQVSGKVNVIEGMVDNFSYLIDTLGFIPNGNRTYFLGRSQPPFYALMVSLLSELKGKGILVKYLPFLEKEYGFWMNGRASLERAGDAIQHVVQVEGGVLNRYFDHHAGPRAEMYQNDVELSRRLSQPPEQLYSNLRAACESGWDFSARWFRNPTDLGTIHTTEILPVDLNCLLYFLERTISKAYHESNNKAASEKYLTYAEKRKALIQTYFWNEQSGYYHDYDFVADKQKTIITAAGMFPLFFKIAREGQAKSCAAVIQKELLRDGGLVTTPINSGEQWDAPNGWAPLQWIGIRGLQNYGLLDLAREITTRWCDLNTQVYLRTGKLLEKYNVEDVTLLSGGGEYKVQDGFGWTNGVLLKLISKGV